MSVNFSIHYKDGTSNNVEDVPCFGSLREENDSFYEDKEIADITYYPSTDMDNKVLVDLLKNHPVLSKPILSIDIDSVSVSPNYPADLVLGCLSFARTLFCRDKELKPEILSLINKGYKPDVAAFFVDSSQASSTMFRYIEESLVQDWSVSQFIEWLENPVDKSIEEDYSKCKTYESVKSSLSGKPFSDYNYDDKRRVTRAQVSELIRWEKGKDFLFCKEEKEK